MSVEDFIIRVYCLIDELLKKQENTQKIRKRAFRPALSDSDMITMKIISEFLRIDTDKGAWEYFCNHWRFLFPAIGSRANFAKQAAKVWIIKQRIQKQ